MIALMNILVATDFSKPSDSALEYGRTLAGQFEAALHVVHIVDDIATKNITADGFLTIMPELQKELEDAARAQLHAMLARGSQGPQPRARVITSNTTARAIVEYAKEARIDLIVVGTQGRGGISRLLLGSVAERLVRTAPCPVLTVHSFDREFVRPDAPAAGAAG